MDRCPQRIRSESSHIETAMDILDSELRSGADQEAVGDALRKLKGIVADIQADSNEASKDLIKKIERALHRTGLQSPDSAPSAKASRLSPPSPRSSSDQHRSSPQDQSDSQASPASALRDSRASPTSPVDPSPTDPPSKSPPAYRPGYHPGASASSSSQMNKIPVKPFPGSVSKQPPIPAQPPAQLRASPPKPGKQPPPAHLMYPFLSPEPEPPTSDIHTRAKSTPAIHNDPSDRNCFEASNHPSRIQRPESVPAPAKSKGSVVDITPDWNQRAKRAQSLIQPSTTLEQLALTDRQLEEGLEDKRIKREYERAQRDFHENPNTNWIGPAGVPSPPVTGFKPKSYQWDPNRGPPCIRKSRRPEIHYQFLHSAHP